MTIDKIKQAAVLHFSQKGYEGASLADIAADAGIKKQSLYTYFQSKDQLFLHTIDDVVKAEIQFIDSSLKNNSDSSGEEILYALLGNFRNKFHTANETRFLLRICFFPPEHLHSSVMEKSYLYLDSFESKLSAFMAQRLEKPQAAEEAAIAFLSVFDAAMLELLYGGEKRFERRVAALWPFYLHGLHALGGTLK
ncbi:TetR/AcrR family transcriptional regulator [Metabacillus lacus]|nr:TetR/AcrR family transcriptional regulator [Metabacillus lacus]